MTGFKKRTWIIGTVVAALLGSAAVASRYNNASMEDRVNFGTYMVTKRLELNDAQEASLDNLAKSWIESSGTIKSFRNALLEEIKTLAEGENLSVVQVNALREKIKTEFDRRADAMIPQFVTFYNGLDAGQKGKIIARLDDVSKHMGKRGSRGHWGGKAHPRDSE